MIPQWRLTDPVTVKYLRNIDESVAKWKMHFTIVTPTDTNHVMTEYSYTKTQVIDTGENVRMHSGENFAPQHTYMYTITALISHLMNWGKVY